MKSLAVMSSILRRMSLSFIKSHSCGVFFGVNGFLETAVLFTTGARRDSQLNNSFDKVGRFVKKGR